MFEKTNRPEKIIQFGEGVFLRAFADWIIEEVNQNTDFNGSAVVVQPLKEGLCDRLSAQNCVYTCIMRGLDNGNAVVKKKLIKSISRCVKPYDDYDEFLRLAENPDFRFVISNTTESGIAFCHEDELCDSPHKSFPAKVTALLYRRFELGLKGFIFLPCELIEKNGDTLKAIVLKYADKWELSHGFKAWVENENIFCNTLVDRIVTGFPKDNSIQLGYEDNMADTCELFHLWVIEGPKSILSEFPLDKAGLNVIVTDNLERYRTRKVRILNGAHTAMIPYALLEGVESVKECMENTRLSEFVRSCVYNEIIPTLDLPKGKLEEYARNVFERFENPFIHHLCASISLNSVSKFKVRVLPSIKEYILRTGKMPHKLIFSFAKLIEFYKNGKPSDAKEIISFMKEKSIPEILASTYLWDEDLSYLANEITKVYEGKI